MKNKDEELTKILNSNELKNTVNGRLIVGASIIGSQFYGLETEDSDFDFKVFVLPTFDDLYNNSEISKSLKILENDVDIKDIRKIETLLEKGSAPYVEALVSPYSFWNDNYSILKNEDNKIPVNVPKWLHALKGMTYMKWEAIKKDYPTQETNEGYKRKIKYGFDTKQLLHIARIKNIVEVVYNQIANGNNPVVSSKLFIVDDYLRNYLLGIKENKGNLNKVQAIDFAERLIDDINQRIDLIDKFYDKNPQKLKEIEKNCSSFYQKFKEINKNLIKQEL